MANFNLWSTLSNFFLTSSGPVNGEDWAASNVGDGGNPIWTDTETPAANYTPGAPRNYTIVLTTQDWLGDEQPLVTITTDTDIVDPFGNNAFSIGNLVATQIFSSNNTTASGAVLYWQASTTPGDYALEFEPITETFLTAPDTGPNTVVSGSPVTLLPAVVDPTSWSFNSSTPTSIVVAYTTQAVSSPTEDVWFQAFSNTGAATSPAVEVLTGLPDSTQYFIGYSTDYASTGGYDYRYTVVDAADPADTGVWGGTFDPTTGALGNATELIPLPSFTAITGLLSRSLSNGDALRFVEGVAGGQDVIQAFLSTSSTATATFSLTNANDKIASTNVYDPGDGQLDYTVLAYTDNNQVHLEFLDQNGDQIGSDFVVPGLTSFDRIHTLTGSVNAADKRVEIDYTVTDPSGGTEIEGVIYDTSTGPDVYTIGGAGSNEYEGTPFNDTLTWASGVNFLDGGGGTDTFVATNFTASQVSVTVNAQGNVVVADTTGDVDTLRRFSTIQLSGAVIGIYGNTLVQTNSDNSKVVSTFNIGGNSAASSVLDYTASLTLTSETLNHTPAAVSGSDVSVILNSAQAAVAGGADTVDFASGSGNAVGLSSTGSAFDAVDGSNGVIAITSAYTTVSGGGDAIYFENGSNAAELSNTGGVFDTVFGSGNLVTLTSAYAEVTGGGDQIDFLNASGNIAALYSTAGVWDGVSGSGGEVAMTSAYVELFGGNDAVYLEGNTGNALAIYNSGSFDNVNGSDALVVLTNSFSTVTGGGDSIYFEGAGNAAALYSTGGVFDGVNGSSGEVVLTDAQATVVGGGNVIYLEGASGNTAALYNTGSAADAVNGSNGTIVLTNAQATVTGASNSIYFSGNNTVTANGASEAFVFQPTIGEDTINNFASTDTMQFSASDFANFAALQSHTTQSGANTVITLDATDTVTLTNFTATNLVSSEFHFV